MSGVLRFRPLLLLGAVLIPLCCWLLYYSVTAAFAWDEGFHVVTAQLIAQGKRPYLDFCFPQTPLNAYWNALWIRIFGENWHAIHVVAALESIAATLLTVQFLLTRFPEPGWRLPAALFAAASVAANNQVVQYGTIGQAYGLCLFLIVAAFRLTIASIERRNLLIPLLAGLAAGAAAGSSLLTAPVGPVLVLWMVFQRQASARWLRVGAFLAGVAAAWIPVMWLFAQSPRVVLFNLIHYHLLYRQVDWPDAVPHDIDVMLSSVNSGQALILVLLAAAGLLFVYFRSGWSAFEKSQFYLCAWLSLAISVHLATAHPTFERYFLFAVPFTTILAAAGIYAIASRVFAPDRPWVTVSLLMAVMLIGFGKKMYDNREDFSWHDLEKAAAEVEKVTPRDATLLADEQIYFLTRRVPPMGSENSDSHKLKLSPAELAALHIVPQDELVNQVKSGRFHTVEACDEDKIDELSLAKVYSKKSDLDECYVFSNAPASAPPASVVRR